MSDKDEPLHDVNDPRIKPLQFEAGTKDGFFFLNIHGETPYTIRLDPDAADQLSLLVQSGADQARLERGEAASRSVFSAIAKIARVAAKSKGIRIEERHPEPTLCSEHRWHVTDSDGVTIVTTHDERLAEALHMMLSLLSGG